MIVFPDLSRVGRLGNALFQFAATVGIAKMRHEGPGFNADWIHRPYFSVPDEFFYTADELQFMLDDGGTHLKDCLELHHIRERHRIYAQDVNLFDPILPVLRNWLAPSPLAQQILADEAADRIPSASILAVHVRRGDNVPGQDKGVPDKQNYYVLPSLAYYVAAIDDLRQRHPDIVSVAVFTDDPDWCEEYLGGVVDYVHRGIPRPKEHEREYATAPVLDWVDLQLMARCKYHVVTGSTFGIWGAMLADSADTVRCTPVYGPKLADINENLMFPSTWKTMESR